MKRAYPASLLIFAGILLLNGCFLTRHWIEGKWRYDAERTKAANRSMQQADSGPVIARLKGIIGGALEGAMTASLENSVVEFTGTEMRTIQGSTTQSVPYRIVGKPDANTVLIERTGKAPIAYHREGAAIWFKPADDLDFRVYLKRAS